MTQHEALSKDGTRIPYFQVGPRKASARRQEPDGAVWLRRIRDRGGAALQRQPRRGRGSKAAACTSWRTSAAAESSGRAGTRPRSRRTASKAFEDFIAVAEDLIARKVTSTRHLGIMGGSNGGLLVGNMLTMRPDLFGAVVCQVPLLDMRRYHQLLAGASWVAEYGNPDDPNEWAFIRTFSPYHNLSRRRALSADAVHHLDARRPRPPRPCAQDGGAHAGARTGRAVLREHRGRSRRRRRQPQRARMWALTWSFPRQAAALTHL